MTKEILKREGHPCIWPEPPPMMKASNFLETEALESKFGCHAALKCSQRIIGVKSCSKSEKIQLSLCLCDGSVPY